MGAAPTRLADELGLALSIGLFAMPTGRTSPGRVPGIHRHDGDSGQFRLVCHKGIELSERPTREPIPGVGATSRDPLADALEVFKGDPSIRAFGLLDDRLADAVVFVATEPGFLPGHPAQLLLRPLGVPPLEPLALEVVLPADAFDVGPGVLLAVAVGGDVRDTQIDPDEVGGRDRSPRRDVRRHQQEPLAVIPEDEVGLPLGPRELLRLVLAQHEGHEDATAERQQAHAVDALEGHHPLIEGHRGGRAEDGPDTLVALVSLADLGDAADRHLRRQAEPLAKLPVAGVLQLDLVGRPLLEGDPAQPICRFVEAFDGLAEPLGVLAIWQQLQLDG